jgi:hypothetical protein
MGQTIFVTYLSEAAEARSVFRFITSLRRFGGSLKDSPVWVIAASPDLADELAFAGVEIFPSEMDLPDYLFSGKVAARAQAEAAAGSDTSNLVWVNPGTLFVRPPDLFGLDLPEAVDAAFRPVHIRNVGSLNSLPLDPYWSAIYQAVGLKATPFSVESFVDEMVIRPYFNTHIFAVRPAKGLMQAWWSRFLIMIEDQAFQSSACKDMLHRIFLHQAILSALLVRELPAEKLRLLPPTYNYPLQLHRQVPSEKRPERLDDLVCAVYEDAFVYPETLSGLKASPDLADWLK